MIEAKMGIRNFWRFRRKNLFTLLAISIGTTGLISLGGYIDRWDHTLRADAIYLKGRGTLSIYKAGGYILSRSQPKKFTLTRLEQDLIYRQLKEMPGVEYSGPILQMTGLASNGCTSKPYEAIGYDPSLDAKLRNHPLVREWCSEGAGFKSGASFASFPQKEVVGLATGLASFLGKSTPLKTGEISPPFTGLLSAYCEEPGVAGRLAADPNLQLMAQSFDGQFNAIDADLVHIFSNSIKLSEDTRLTAPIALLQELYQTDRVSSIAVYLKDYREGPEFSSRLREALAREGLSVDVHLWNDRTINPFYQGVMNFLGAMRLFCCFLIGSVVVLSVVNLTTISVMQRSKEVGTLKALGFSSFAIVRIFMVEAIVLGALGCASGGLLSLLVASVVNHSGLRFNPPGFVASVPFLLVADGLTLALVLLLVFLLVALAAGITTGVLARRSCLELLTRQV